MPALPLRNTLRPEFGIFIFVIFSAKLRLGRVKAVVTGGGSPYFSFGNSFNEKKIRAYIILAITDLGLPNLCINSLESSRLG